MNIPLPDLSLVVLIGPSGAGKSSFASTHFKATETISSDFCRGLVADDENDQAASNDAFAVLHYIAARRLASGRLTVIDATNVQPEARKPLVEPVPADKDQNDIGDRERSPNHLLPVLPRERELGVK